MVINARGLQDEYLIGRHFLEVRRAELDLKPSQWASLAKGKPARQPAERVAKELKVSFPKLKEAIKFATAVETLTENCGESAWSVIFDHNRPQARKAIMTLSRTSDVRQRHRVQGVLEGRFSSVAPHPDDTVFDTVSFGEVLSRLRRARGWLGMLPAHLTTIHDHMIVEEVSKLSRLCEMSTKLLDACLTDECLNNGGAPLPELPDDLSKESVLETVRSKAVRGQEIGCGRAALRLIVKNVWDFEEMMRRGLEPTAEELQKTQSEIERIREIAKQIECLGRSFQKP